MASRLKLGYIIGREKSRKLSFFRRLSAFLGVFSPFKSAKQRKQRPKKSVLKEKELTLDKSVATISRLFGTQESPAYCKIRTRINILEVMVTYD